MGKTALSVVLMFGLLAVVSVAQVSTLAQATGTVPAAQPAPSADRALAREILEELVEIPTTEADGTTRAAQTTFALVDRAR